MVSIASIPLSGWSGDQILFGTKDFFCSPKCPEQHSGPLRLLFKKSTTDVHLVLRLQWNYTTSPTICLHGMGIGTCYGLYVLGIKSQCGHWIFCTSPDWPCGPPNLLYREYRVSLHDVRHPGPGIHGWYKVGILVGTEYFSLLQIVQTGSEAHSAFC